MQLLCMHNVAAVAVAAVAVQATAVAVAAVADIPAAAILAAAVLAALAIPADAPVLVILADAPAVPTTPAVAPVPAPAILAAVQAVPATPAIFPTAVLATIILADALATVLTAVLVPISEVAADLAMSAEAMLYLIAVPAAYPARFAAVAARKPAVAMLPEAL